MNSNIKWKFLPLMAVGTVILAACGGDEPRVERSEIEIGDSAITVDFDQTDDFETGTFEDGSSLVVADGQYVIQSTNAEGNRYLIGKSNVPSASLKNVVIEAEATFESGSVDNWFGVLCRVDDHDTGYAFLISADGFWAIARANGTSLDFLENWRESDVIRGGRNANTIEAYCVEDYLALYINGDFVGDHSDDGDQQLDRVGTIGLLAGGPRENVVTVVFDDLVIRPVNRSGQPNTPTLLSTETTAELSDVTPQPLATLDLAPVEPQSTAEPSDDQRSFGG